MALTMPSPSRCSERWATRWPGSSGFGDIDGAGMAGPAAVSNGAAQNRHGSTTFRWAQRPVVLGLKTLLSLNSTAKIVRSAEPREQVATDHRRRRCAAPRDRAHRIEVSMETK